MGVGWGCQWQERTEQWFTCGSVIMVCDPKGIVVVPGHGSRWFLRSLPMQNLLWFFFMKKKSVFHKWAMLQTLYEEKITGPIDVGNIKTWFLGKLHLTHSVEDYATIVVWIQPYWMSDRKIFLMPSRREQEGNHTLMSAIVRPFSQWNQSSSVYLGIQPFSPKFGRI